MGERSRRRVRDLVTQLAFEGLSENEIGRARISMMARSDLLHARAGYRSARPNHCSEDSACNARPVHTEGSKLAVARTYCLRFTPDCRHAVNQRSLRLRAM